MSAFRTNFGNIRFAPAFGADRNAIVQLKGYPQQSIEIDSIGWGYGPADTSATNILQGRLLVGYGTVPSSAVREVVWPLVENTPDLLGPSFTSTDIKIDQILPGAGLANKGAGDWIHFPHPFTVEPGQDVYILLAAAYCEGDNIGSMSAHTVALTVIGRRKGGTTPFPKGLR
jgi:hypothetical protein